MPRSHLTTTLLTLSLALAVALTTALAQTVPLEVASHDLSFQYPQGWAVADDVDADGLLTIELSHPSGGGVIVVVAALIGPADRDYWSQPRNVLLSDVWTGFQPEVPGSRELQRYEADVGGLPGSVLDYASDQLAGSIVVAVGPNAAYTVISAADQDRLPEVHAALELVVSSLRPPSLAHGAPTMPATPPATPEPPATPANPLDPAPTPPTVDTAPVNPLDPPGVTNPLDPPADAPTNPLDGAAAPAGNPLDRVAPPAVDPFVGRFADPDVTLVLEAAGGAYAGEIVVLGAPYPVEATLAGGRLEGNFRSGEQRFAFSAELSGDTLVLESDGARFVLQRSP